MDNILNLISSSNESFGGVTFVNIKGYRSSKFNGSEQKDILLNVGGSFDNEKEKDAETLRNLARNKQRVIEIMNSSSKLKTVEVKGQKVRYFTMLRAIAEMVQSAVAPDFVRSEAQKNAYIPLNANGSIGYCEETGNINIKGTVVRVSNVVILDEVVYREIKEKMANKKYRKLTVPCKEAIQSALYDELRSHKKRSLTVTLSQFVNLNGESIEFDVQK